MEKTNFERLKQKLYALKRDQVDSYMTFFHEVITVQSIDNFSSLRETCRGILCSFYGDITIFRNFEEKMIANYKCALIQYRNQRKEIEMFYIRCERATFSTGTEKLLAFHTPVILLYDNLQVTQGGGGREKKLNEKVEFRFLS